MKRFTTIAVICLIALTSCIQLDTPRPRSFSRTVLLCRTITALAFFGVFLLLAVIFKNKIGGADVKFIAAAMFVCGFPEGLAGLILGLLFSVIGTLIRNRKTKSKDKIKNATKN